MGNFSSRIASLFVKRKPQSILMFGLDAAGKTTVLYKVARRGYDDIITTIPTIGFNVETLNIKGSILTVWDVGGRDKIRPLWRHYYRTTDAIIFVFDSNDHDRIDIAKDELHRTLSEDELKEKPLLVLCNKQDLLNAWSTEKIIAHLGLNALSNRRWMAMGSVAIKGEGLYEGFDWLSQALREKKRETTSNTLSSVYDEAKKLELSTTSKDDDELGYDPTEGGGNSTLKHFSAIKNGTECPFAKTAKLWGGRPITQGSSLEEQAKSNVAPLTKFVKLSNEGKMLDGFCIEIVDDEVNKGGPRELGECVRRYLTALSDDDPAGESMMRVNYIGSRGWRFRFGKADFFVTTFAPFYPSTSSRHAFGANSTFVLFQPEESFARRHLPFDTPITNWEMPKTLRDKTRVAFKNAGRMYHIPETTSYPPAEHIVKPLKDDGNATVRWWQGLENQEERNAH